MISASKTTFSLNNFKCLRPKVMKNLTNLLKMFCEFPPCSFLSLSFFLYSFLSITHIQRRRQPMLLLWRKKEKTGYVAYFKDSPHLGSISLTFYVPLLCAWNQKAQKGSHVISHFALWGYTCKS